ncbi:MAG: hypothetical protein QXT79_11650 [Thermofilaceae archaeon]
MEIERNIIVINEPAAQAGAGAAAMRVDAPATAGQAPRAGGAEQGGYILFTYVRRKVYWDGTVTNTLSAIIAPTPQAAHAFRRLISRLLLTRREIAYYAHRRGVQIALLTTVTEAPNATIEKALQRAGVPLEKALPLGEVLPRLPEWLKRGVMCTEVWAAYRRRKKDAVKEVPPPKEWPFNPKRVAQYVVSPTPFREVEIYRFKKRVVISFENTAISIDLTRSPEELLFSASSSLSEEAIDLLLKWREEICEEVPELEPFFSLLSLVR